VLDVDVVALNHDVIDGRKHLLKAAGPAFSIETLGLWARRRISTSDASGAVTQEAHVHGSADEVEGRGHVPTVLDGRNDDGIGQHFRRGAEQGAEDERHLGVEGRLLQANVSLKRDL
jgi:hypothetical protein